MKPIHYGWIIVGTGVLVKMAGLGFGRFACPMLISMAWFEERRLGRALGVVTGGTGLGGYLKDLTGSFLLFPSPVFSYAYYS